MTKLLDTGYLETDDPVVAACFLEKRIRREHCTDFGGNEGPGYFDDEDEWHELPWEGTLVSVCEPHVWLAADETDEGFALDWPILIPASVVAERVKAPRVWDVITWDNTQERLATWLRKHTGG